MLKRILYRGVEEQTVFDNAKLAIKNAQFIFFINFLLTILLRTDSSDNGISGVLLNVDNEGNERAITYISHVLSDAAKNGKQL